MGGPALTGELQGGIVKVCFEDKGFGFVTQDTGGGDVYVHRSKLNEGQALTEGTRVTFEREWDGQRGKFAATNVSIATGVATPEPGQDDSNKGLIGGVPFLGKGGGFALAGKDGSEGVRASPY